MQFETTTYPDLIVVHLREARIDAAGAIDFKERMREYTQDPSLRVMLDLSQVAFIDSSGLGAVVAVRKSLGPDRQLELAGLTSAVQKVFRLTRMDSVFPIYDSIPEGTGGLRNAG
jgi:anti-sigma B factor antagonist